MIGVSNDSKRSNIGPHKANFDPTSINPSILPKSDLKGVFEKRGTGKKSAHGSKETPFVERFVNTPIDVEILYAEDPKHKFKTPASNWEGNIIIIKHCVLSVVKDELLCKQSSFVL